MPLSRIEDSGHDQDNAMTNGVDWFYPDDLDDALTFFRDHGAVPANPIHWPWPDWQRPHQPTWHAPRPINDRTPNAFWQAVVILGIIALILGICCGIGSLTAVRIWGH